MNRGSLAVLFVALWWVGVACQTTGAPEKAAPSPEVSGFWELVPTGGPIEVGSVNLMKDGSFALSFAGQGFGNASASGRYSVAEEGSKTMVKLTLEDIQGTSPVGSEMTLEFVKDRNVLVGADGVGYAREGDSAGQEYLKGGG